MIFMLTSEFNDKLRRLNRDLWVDFNHKTVPEHPDFPATGLFCRGSFVMGVPLGNLYPEATWGVNLRKLELEDENVSAIQGDWLDNDWVEYHQKYNPDKVDDRIISRGYVFILSELVRLGYIHQDDAERVFCVRLNPHKPEKAYRRRYMGLNFEGE